MDASFSFQIVSQFDEQFAVVLANLFGEADETHTAMTLDLLREYISDVRSTTDKRVLQLVAATHLIRFDRADATLSFEKTNNQWVLYCIGREKQEVLAFLQRLKKVDNTITVRWLLRLTTVLDVLAKTESA